MRSRCRRRCFPRTLAPCRACPWLKTPPDGFATEPDESRRLDLPDALAGALEDRADLVEEKPALLGDIERAALLELRDVPVRVVELDRAGLLVDLEKEVVPARHPGARARPVLAV